jgi:hypothetical protein
MKWLFTTDLNEECGVETDRRGSAESGLHLFCLTHFHSYRLMCGRTVFLGRAGIVLNELFPATYIITYT